MKKTLIVLLLLVIVNLSLRSQGTSTGFFENKTYVGPSLGYGFGSVSFGAQGEYATSENIGIGADIGYTSFSDAFGISSNFGQEAKVSYTLFGILFSGSYHFMPKKQFDPYIKLGLGYFNWDVSFSDNSGMNSGAAAYASGVGIGAQVGARYHFNDNLSARLSLGTPFLFAAGVDYAFGKATNAIIKQENEVKAAETRQNRTPETTTSTATTEQAPADNYGIYIGPYVGANMSLNTAVANGFKVSPELSAPDFGAQVLVPFGKKSTIGFMLDIGSSKTSFTTKPETKDVDSNTVKETYSYFNVSPQLYLSGFIIGLNFGLSPTQTAQNLNEKDYYISYMYDSETKFKLREKAKDSYLKTRMDLKVGGAIKLLNDENGMLNLNIMATYNLSGLYEKAENYYYAYEIDNANSMPKEEAKNSLNPTPVSLSLGLSYLFRLGF